MRHASLPVCLQQQMESEDGQKVAQIQQSTANVYVNCKLSHLSAKKLILFNFILFVLFRIDELFTKGNDERYLVSPKALLVDAVRMNQEIGSCTCVVVVLDEKASVISTCNLGDSGYMLLRKEADKMNVIYESKEQQHSFNFPFQVGTNGDDPQKGESNAHNV